MGPCVRSLILASCLTLATTAPAQETRTATIPGDFHTREDDARRLYSLSAFAHGHRHGYEEGYLAADEDLHLGRLQRTLHEKDVPRPKDYKKEFGDKRHFRQGFVLGYLAGYRDSTQERPFQLPSWVAAIQPFAAMSDLPQGEGSFQPNSGLLSVFDDGMMEGYRSGLVTEVLGTDAHTMAAHGSDLCQAKQGRPDGYCDGFTQGFLIGLSDAGRPISVEGAGLASSATQPH